MLRTISRPSGALRVARAASAPFFASPQPAVFARAAAPRAFSDAASSMSDAENAIAASLTSHEALRPISSVLVRDVSGGCGSMYAIEVASPRFKGLGLLAQQRLVNKALGDQVKAWHGVQIRTSVPQEE